MNEELTFDEVIILTGFSKRYIKTQLDLGRFPDKNQNGLFNKSQVECWLRITRRIDLLCTEEISAKTGIPVYIIRKEIKNRKLKPFKLNFNRFLNNDRLFFDKEVVNNWFEEYKETQNYHPNFPISSPLRQYKFNDPSLNTRQLVPIKDRVDQTQKQKSPLLTIKEIAELAKVHIDTVYQWKKKKLINPTAFLTRPCRVDVYLFNKLEVLDFISKRNETKSKR